MGFFGKIGGALKKGLSIGPSGGPLGVMKKIASPIAGMAQRNAPPGMGGIVGGINKSMGMGPKPMAPPSMAPLPPMGMPPNPGIDAGPSPQFTNMMPMGQPPSPPPMMGPMGGDRNMGGMGGGNLYGGGGGGDRSMGGQPPMGMPPQSMPGPMNNQMGQGSQGGGLFDRYRRQNSGGLYGG